MLSLLGDQNLCIVRARLRCGQSEGGRFLVQFRHGAGIVMAISKRLPPMSTVKELLGTHEQLSTSLLRGVEFEYVVDVLEECPIEE